MSNITMRIWSGSRVVGVVSVSADGSGASSVGAPGGAHNGARPDIELDPWDNLVMDHRPEHFTPLNWREAEAHECVGGRIDPEDVRAYDMRGGTCASG